MKKKVLGWTIAAGAVAAVTGILLWSYNVHQSARAAEASAGAAIENPATVATEAGEPVVTLDDDVQERMGIETEAVPAMTRRPQTVAYGALEEDPENAFVLRAPVAGTIQAATTKTWPDVGSILSGNENLGQVEPRLAPADRIGLNDRLASAQADAEVIRASLTADQAALARTRTLNADDKNVSDRALQEAEAQVAADQAKLKGAQQSAQLLTAALAPGRQASAPLGLSRGGTVVEVLAHPGESVESGQVLLRVADFGRLLARVDVPAGQAVAPGITSASIVPLGSENKPLTGERVGFGASVDPKTQGQPFVFRVTGASGALRPGLSVTAYLETPGPARTGEVAPRSAVIWQTGRTWVYVQTAKEKFARREVQLEDPVAAGWFTRSLKPGDKVVTRGAQMLLSEEFKSQIRVEDDDN